MQAEVLLVSLHGVPKAMEYVAEVMIECTSAVQHFNGSCALCLGYASCCLSLRQ